MSIWTKKKRLVCINSYNYGTVPVLLIFFCHSCHMFCLASIQPMFQNPSVTSTSFSCWSFHVKTTKKRCWSCKAGLTKLARQTIIFSESQECLTGASGAGLGRFHSMVNWLEKLVNSILEHEPESCQSYQPMFSYPGKYDLNKLVLK